MPNDCPYCGKPHFNFGDDEEGVEMWINEPNDGEHVIVVDPPYAWSIPINYCPFCGRKLEKVSLCHAAYFCKGWENARGCRIEHDAAVAYGLEVLYED